MNDTELLLCPELKKKKKKDWPTDPPKFSGQKGKQTFYFLGLMILSADKGRAVVVMNTVDYKNKAQSLLSDNETYMWNLNLTHPRKNKIKLVKILQSIKESGTIISIKYRQF